MGSSQASHGDQADDLSRLPWSHFVVALNDDAERSLELVPDLLIVALDDPRLVDQLPTGAGSCVLAIGSAMRAASALRGAGVEQVYGTHLPPECHYLCQFLEERAAAVRYFADSGHLREVLDAWTGGAHRLEVEPAQHPALQRPLPALEVVSLRQLAATKRRAEIVAGLILDDTLNALIAPPKNFKTVVADALCTAVADESSWLGRAVKKSGLVIDWALEGLAGKADRYRAQIGLQRFLDPSDPIHRRLFLLREMPDITNTPGQDIVLRTIENLTKSSGEPLTLLKVDTLARGMAMCGRDENSTQDMGAFIAGLDRIRANFPCAQMVVHHTGKNGLIERGSTALTGAADLLMFCKRDGKLAANVWVRDARDVEVPDPWYVAFATTIVGTKDDGTDVTSLRVDSVRTADPPLAPTLGAGTESDLAVLEALHSAGDQRLTREQLAETADVSPSTVLATFHRLKRKGGIDREKAGKAWLYFSPKCRATDGQLADASDTRHLPPARVNGSQLSGVSGPSLEGPRPSVADRQGGPRRRRRAGGEP